MFRVCSFFLYLINCFLNCCLAFFLSSNRVFLTAKDFSFLACCFTFFTAFLAPFACCLSLSLRSTLSDLLTCLAVFFIPVVSAITEEVFLRNLPVAFSAVFNASLFVLGFFTLLTLASIGFSIDNNSLAVNCWGTIVFSLLATSSNSVSYNLLCRLDVGSSPFSIFFCTFLNKSLLLKSSGIHLGKVLLVEVLT